MGAALAVGDPTTSKCCADGGPLELRDALMAKVAAENGLQNADCMVTTGANQAYRHLRTSAYRHLRTSAVVECLHLPPFFYISPSLFLSLMGVLADQHLPIPDAHARTARPGRS